MKVLDGYSMISDAANVRHWVTKMTNPTSAVCGKPMTPDMQVVPAELAAGSTYCGACSNSVFARHHGKGRPR